ncbi:hypothetical protein ACFL1B_04975 [Nanoarchaeota archaeon]
MGKRGQFTILVIFGLMVIIVVGIIFLLRHLLLSTTMEGATEEALQDFLRSDKVSLYVESCLQAVSEQAILMATYQGGNLWSHQGGAIDMDFQGSSRKGLTYLPVTYDRKTFNTSYVIQPTSFARCEALRNNSEPWQYPYPGSIGELLDPVTFLEQCGYTRAEGFFGIKTLPVLCLVHGPNYGGDPNRVTVYSNCEFHFATIRDRPLQWQLANFTSHALMQCSDFTDLEDTGGFTVEVLQNPEVEFTLGREDVTIKATYPLKMSQSGRPPKNVNAEFYHQINTRLKELYEFYWDIVLKDIQNVYFDPEEDYLASPLYKADFEVEVQKDYCPDCIDFDSNMDDLLIISDASSRVGSDDLKIFGVIKNRAPVLNPIKLKMVNTRDLTSEVLDQVDIVVVNGTRLLLSPMAIDPDGDAVRYTYSLWRGNETAKCTANNWMLASSKNTATQMAEFLRTACISNAMPAPNDWAFSFEFQTTAREAMIETTMNDIGLNKVRIYASDDSAFDYYDYEVLVLPSEFARSEGWSYCLSEADCTGKGYYEEGLLYYGDNPMGSDNFELPTINYPN